MDSASSSSFPLLPAPNHYLSPNNSSMPNTTNTTLDPWSSTLTHSDAAKIKFFIARVLYLLPLRQLNLFDGNPTLRGFEPCENERTPDWFIQGIQSNVAPEDAQSLLLGVYYLLQLPIGVWGWALPNDEDGHLETFRESIHRSSHEHTAISLYLLAEGFGYKMRSDMNRFGYRSDAGRTEQARLVRSDTLAWLLLGSRARLDPQQWTNFICTIEHWGGPNMFSVVYRLNRAIFEEERSSVMKPARFTSVHPACGWTTVNPYRGAEPMLSPIYELEGGGCLEVTERFDGREVLSTTNEDIPFIDDNDMDAVSITGSLRRHSRREASDTSNASSYFSCAWWLPRDPISLSSCDLNAPIPSVLFPMELPSIPLPTTFKAYLDFDNDGSRTPTSTESTLMDDAGEDEDGLQYDYDIDTRVDTDAPRKVMIAVRDAISEVADAVEDGKWKVRLTKTVSGKLMKRRKVVVTLTFEEAEEVKRPSSVKRLAEKLARFF